jgi:DNA-binding winged helix-turn-helix (wHTH) protein
MRLVYEDFQIDLEGRQLFRHGREVTLERRVVDMLCYLAARPGQLVVKDELVAEVWHARALSDGALANAASKLRKALGQAPQANFPLETVHGRGYRWRAVQRTSTTPSQGLDVGPAADALDGPFVGRVPVLKALFDAVERAAQHRGQLVLIRGEAGIGKTRTMKELVNHARQRGFRSWIGAAYEAAGAPAYWPWVQILRSSREQLPDDVWRRHVPAGSWALSRLLPELRATARPDSGADAQAVRFQLFDELARFLASASADEPILVAVEDLHAADSGTIELLAHVARALEQHAVLLIATLRDFAPAEDKSHAAATSRLERIATCVRLTGLSPEEIAALVGVKSAGTAVSDVLFARTRGNPFFISQLLDLLLQRGQPINAANLTNLELPAAVLDAIRQRLQTLGNDSRAALDVASVVGQEFDAQLVAMALSHTLEEVLTALEPALRMGMLAPGAAVHRFAFTHGLLRDALHDELTLPRSGALHSKLAAILAARPAGDARQLGEVARHYLSAVPSELETCVRFCREAAETARRASGFETAADFLSRALQKLESEGGDDRVRCELLHDVAVDYFCVGNIEAAWRALGQGLALARRAGEPRAMARFACSLVDWLELGGFDEAEARAAVEEALLADAGEMRAGLLARRARLGFELPAEERAALLDEATRLAERAGTVDELIEVLICRAVLWNPTRVEDGRSAIAMLRALLAAHPKIALDPRLPLLRFAIDVSEYVYALIAGDTSLADQAATRFAAMAEKRPQSTLGLVVQVMRAGQALRDRRFEELDRVVSGLRESAGPTGGLSRVWLFYAFFSSEARGDTSAWSGVDLGDPSVLLQLAARQRPGAHLLIAWFYAKTGRLEKAGRFLSEVPRSELVRMPVQHGDLGLLCYLAEIYREQNDVEGAAWLRDKLAPYATLHAIGPAFEYRGPVAQYISLLTSMTGDQRVTIEELATRATNHHI